MTPVEIVGYEVDEAGSPLALDNGQFTLSNAPVYHKVKLWCHGHCVDGRAGNRYGQNNYNKYANVKKDQGVASLILFFVQSVNT